MNEIETVRVGFHVRNPFQIRHFRPLFGVFPKSIWIASNRKVANGKDLFGENVRFVPRERLGELDNRLDVIVTQGSVHGFLSRCQTVMIQYGYAKAPYNFGLWRAEADVVLAYGEYAQERLSFWAPTAVIGNPRLDDWNDTDFHMLARRTLGATLDPNVKTITYAPTWGTLSSIERWLDSVAAMGDRFNVLVKAHHNTKLRSKGRKKGVHFLPDADLFMLLSVSDLLVSDYSGAIFDAVMCDRPVVLLSHNTIDTQFGGKLDASSPEIALRSNLGTIVDEPGDFADACQTALANWSGGHSSLVALKSEFFKTDGLAADSFRVAILDLVSGRFTKTEQQEHLHRFATSDARRKLRDGRRFFGAGPHVWRTFHDNGNRFHHLLCLHIASLIVLDFAVASLPTAILVVRTNPRQFVRNRNLILALPAWQPSNAILASVLGSETVSQVPVVQ